MADKERVRPAGHFATTRWSLVLEAGRNGHRSRQALESLCELYWLPVYSFIRRQGYPADDALERWAADEGVAVYRGSEDDVLARVVEAHASMRSDVVVELTGDCVLLDAEIVDPRRLVLGSDTPFPLGEPDPVGFITRGFAAGRPEVAETILQRNAAKFLGLSDQPAAA